MFTLIVKFIKMFKMNPHHVLLMVVICGQFYRVVLAHGCVHPPYAEQNKTALYRQIFNDYYLGRWTYNAIPEYKKNSYKNQERTQRKLNLGHLVDEQTNVFQYRISGEWKCSKLRKMTKGSDIRTRSTCPWYHVLDYDMNREPQAIAKAKCACKHCIGIGNDGRTTNRCKEVFTYRPVIKWGCPLSLDNTVNFYQYYIHLEEIAVGCTCKLPDNAN